MVGKSLVVGLDPGLFIECNDCRDWVLIPIANGVGYREVEDVGEVT